jgi:hypothetical protein
MNDIKTTDQPISTQDTSTTSRNVLFDNISIIINQLAYVDHLLELVLDLEQKIGQDGFSEELDSKINQLLTLINQSIKSRRNLMLQIEEENEGDHKYWCAVKHAIDSYGKSVEVYFAYKDNDDNKLFYYDNMKDNYEIMISTLSLWLGFDDFVTCARCLAERLN